MSDTIVVAAVSPINSPFANPELVRDIVSSSNVVVDAAKIMKHRDSNVAPLTLKSRFMRESDSSGLSMSFE